MSFLHRVYLVLLLIIVFLSAPANRSEAFKFSNRAKGITRSVSKTNYFCFGRSETKRSMEKILQHSNASVVESPIGTLTRKSFFCSLVFSSLLTALEYQEASAATNDNLLASKTPPKLVEDLSKFVTHTVFFDVRISRRDGTFYARDDDDPTDQVFKGRIFVDLFGTLAPTHVEEFLKYVIVNDTNVDDSPFPSYGRSMFTRLDQSTGLLEGGVIPGLDVINIGGSAALRYSGGRVLSAPLWLEKDSGTYGKVSHGSTVGLVTHRLLDLSPSFGITTRKASELDTTHFAFGRVKLDETSTIFLQKCANLPTYSIDGRIQADNTVIDDLAGKIYATQKDFFRSAAKTLGDSRLDKLYEGKLLRRVDVTRVGLL
jgi:cyclophilin family peptidyl-prolyl cis-trans isomerase